MNTTLSCYETNLKATPSSQEARRAPLIPSTLQSRRAKTTPPWYWSDVKANPPFPPQKSASDTGPTTLAPEGGHPVAPLPTELPKVSKILEGLLDECQQWPSEKERHYTTTQHALQFLENVLTPPVIYDAQTQLYKLDLDSLLERWDTRWADYLQKPEILMPGLMLAKATHQFETFLKDKNVGIFHPLLRTIGYCATNFSLWPKEALLSYLQHTPSQVIYQQNADFIGDLETLFAAYNKDEVLSQQAFEQGDSPFGRFTIAPALRMMDAVERARDASLWD